MKKTHLLINEYNELTLFRERSIHSIESTINTYVTLLGFLITAFTILLSDESIKIIKENLLPISIVFGLAFSFYGFRTFNLIYISHENLVIYTRQLNITRNNLIGKNPKFGKMIYLPTCWQHVEFDKFGHGKVKFSNKGSLGTVKFINSIVISLLLIRLLVQFSKLEIPLIYYFIMFIFLFSVSIFFHNRWIESAKESSEKRWNKIMEAKKYPVYLEKLSSIR